MLEGRKERKKEGSGCMCVCVCIYVLHVYLLLKEEMYVGSPELEF